MQELMVAPSQVISLHFTRDLLTAWNCLFKGMPLRVKNFISYVGRWINALNLETFFPPQNTLQTVNLPLTTNTFPSLQRPVRIFLFLLPKLARKFQIKRKCASLEPLLRSPGWVDKRTITNVAIKHRVQYRVVSKENLPKTLQAARAVRNYLLS